MTADARSRECFDKLIVTMAHLEDAAEMAAFLAPIPNGDRLALVLADRKPVSTRAFDDDALAARFVESDGSVVMCFHVTGITIDQAEMIEVEWERSASPDAAAFRQAVERALHETPREPR